MDENRQKDGSNVLSRCYRVAICGNLDVDLTFFIRVFNLSPLSEAILYTVLSFAGMLSVCFLEIGGCPYLRG